MKSLELARLIAALSLLITAAVGVGVLFSKLRQPRVLGEIIAGLMLGPTLLDAVSPSVEKALFPTSGPTAATLSAVGQLGLLLLMYCSGLELRTVFDRCAYAESSERYPAPARLRRRIRRGERCFPK